MDGGSIMRQEAKYFIEKAKKFLRHSIKEILDWGDARLFYGLESGFSI